MIREWDIEKFYHEILKIMGYLFRGWDSSTSVKRHLKGAFLDEGLSFRNMYGLTFVVSI